MSNEYKDWQAEEITELKQKYEELQFDYYKLRTTAKQVIHDFWNESDAGKAIELLEKELEK